ncbi:WD repeat-containing and planar cell polarity effector protein fritz [Sarcoptes scabiei]|nr:WD repeat-containing and planar cell polarity effector protein fritz [Sarcoptes scabiei]
MPQSSPSLHNDDQNNDRRIVNLKNAKSSVLENEIQNRTIGKHQGNGLRRYVSRQTKNNMDNKRISDDRRGIKLMKSKLVKSAQRRSINQTKNDTNNDVLVLSKVIPSSLQGLVAKSKIIEKSKSLNDHKILIRNIEFLEKEHHHHHHHHPSKSIMKNQIIMKRSHGHHTIKEGRPKSFRPREKSRSSKSSVVDRNQQKHCKQSAQSKHRLKQTIKLNRIDHEDSAADDLQVFSEKQMIELFQSFIKNLKQNNTRSQQIQQRLEESSSSILDDFQSKTIYIEDLDLIELLNDELAELFGNVETLKNSYQDIVKSLVSIQRRPRRRKSKQRLLPETPSEMNESKFDQTKFCGKIDNNRSKISRIFSQQWNEEFDDEHYQRILERFMNPEEREHSFQKLFKQVQQLRKETKQFRSTFNTDGGIDWDRYCINKIDIQQFNRWRQEINHLGRIVEIILQEYNKEVLELFRLSQTSTEFK